MDRQTRTILNDLRISSRTARVPWVLVFAIGANAFLLMVSRTANASAPWHAEAFQKTNRGWKFMANFPEIDERDKEAAIRMGLSFLNRSSK